MRETTERPEGVAAGTAKLVGTDKNRIVTEIFNLLDDSRAYAAMSRAHNPFGDGKSGERIARIIANARRCCKESHRNRSGLYRPANIRANFPFRLSGAGGGCQ